ncbi:hypothetical protein C1637_09720 [Chryseobacterium lactis]|uniref:Uncharacterized protein n=1 Tax=Chryseobacterium lactis TaxID=1241981 RepID=A0A3G6RFH1_CHRLC|nr:hypothetical protein [Chryseobacterium lactis]AZA82212.1 hypothetical protein EG342_09980 [Chryseobacterium lactis]AZB02593.1 hypothetical protein EG341_00835 [Chryseobacterium lactis]PNW14112.1 hypothetical protein C1637_09720 [Chryseobacterium lactis]
MTEEQATALLSQLEKIEKSVLRDISHVKAEIIALRGNVAIEPKQPKQNKSTRLEEMEARIRASYK